MMELGTYTFDRNPTNIPIIKPEKRSAALKTLSGVAYYSFGTFQPGQIVTLTWTIMRTTQWDELQTLNEADEAVVFDPETGSTYNVEIMGLLGEFVVSTAAAQPWKKNVQLSLLILSEV